ncbi:hypothetical protein G3T36_18500 [Diaminobutyricibacter tongyongensis]|uniref:Uncharacterized protein n=1 Tax=Leifsonia tongyongensis TaxID=1268043 RepID=A0A6L9Y2E6_9MICO|nr:hypothetical protein [Diaminobutyricibacter tongyongensis]NEN07851.1 hypothetical protein [Diaminobutyricibacter tongyongensis]
MDFWSQFWATMWGALAGAVVAGVLSWWVATSTLKSQASQRYEDNLDTALAKLFEAIARHISDIERWLRSGMRDITMAPFVSRLQVDVDIAWMAAKSKEDATVMLFVAKVLYVLPKTKLEWRLTELPNLVENVRAWRTDEVTTDQIVGYLDRLAESADRNVRLEL